MSRGPDVVAERWHEVDRLYDEALGLAVAERTRFLTDACAGDTALFDTVTRLLDASARGEESLSAPPTDLLEAALVSRPGSGLEREAPAALPAGTLLGPYRLLREVKRGGMATVYEAERADGAFDRRVAVKMLEGVGSDDLTRRFLTERRILSELSHPHIAQILDGGTTEGGRPYLVMEWVDGERITRWADERRLDVRARLALVRQVAEAVQFAHARLVVHRDIKPSNVLVDAEGRAQLLDFGIAKLLEPETGDGPDTRTETRWMTPEYAAPEQLLGQPVTTATDVYALGVLLHELLTGRRPLEGEGAHVRLGLATGERTPPAMSSVVASTDADIADIADARATTPALLRRTLAGDLDAIVSKALRRAPDERYTSPRELADDLARHLEARPVEARAGLRTYRLRRFVSRNRVAVAAAFSVVLVATAYVVALQVHSRQLAAERDRSQVEATKANSVTTFLVQLFGSADPFVSATENPTAVEIVELGSRRIRSELEEQPEIRAALLEALSQVNQRLGRREQGLELATEALETRLTAGSPERDLALSRRLVGSALVGLDRHDEAEPYLDEALETLVGLHGETHEEVAATLNWMAKLARVQGDNRRAVELYHRELRIYESLGYEDHERVAASLSGLGNSMDVLGEYEEAIDVLQRSVAMYRRLGGQESAQVINPLRSLAEAYRRTGRLREAEEVARQRVELSLAVYDPWHPSTVAAHGALALIVQEAGRFDDAEAIYRTLLESEGEGDARASWLNRAVLRGNLALLLEQMGRHAEAEEIYRENLARYEQRLDRTHPTAVIARFNLAALLHHTGDYVAAEPLFREVLDADRSTLGDEHPEVAVDMARLAVVLRDLERYEEAEGLFLEALPRLEAAFESGHRRIAEAKVGYGGLLAKTGRLDEAVPLLREGLEARRALWTDQHWQTAEAMSLLGAALSERGSHADAEPLLQRAHEILSEVRGTSDRYTVDARRRLIEATESR